MPEPNLLQRLYRLAHELIGEASTAEPAGAVCLLALRLAQYQGNSDDPAANLVHHHGLPRTRRLNWPRHLRTAWRALRASWET